MIRKSKFFFCFLFFFKIFSDISYSIASLTDNEARRYGRFFLGLLETVMAWHSEQTVFENECAQHPGFLTVFRNAASASAAGSVTGSNKQEQLDYENFRHVCHKWHYKLTKSFTVCLESEDYIQMRNALIVLTKIAPQFPKINTFSMALEKRIEKIKSIEKDKRQDIYTLAVVYSGLLKQKKQNMIDESKFHIKEMPTQSITKSGNSAVPGDTSSPHTTSLTASGNSNAQTSTSGPKTIASNTSNSSLAPKQQSASNQQTSSGSKQQQQQTNNSSKQSSPSLTTNSTTNGSSGQNVTSKI
jgi:hypothetical protein